MDAASPAFPRAAAFWWYGCKDATKGTLGNLSGDYRSPGDDGSVGVSSEHRDDHNLTVDDLILDAGETRDKDFSTNSHRHRHDPDFNHDFNRFPVFWS